ncbi:MAG: hypothetical protein M3450_03125, partial [Actinomycetota bacterium]|nr:hypothetical protein [Actinomycetota bacterium]
MAWQRFAYDWANPTVNGVSDPRLWLRGDEITGLASGDPVASWLDRSGHHNDGSQGTAARRPTWHSGVINGHPVVRFVGTENDWLDLPDFASAFTEAEVFCVVKVVADPPGGVGNTSGLWRFGSSGSLTHYPWTNGNVYDDCASTTRRDAGNPAPSLASWRTLNISSKAGEWIYRLDGTTLLTDATNTVGWSPAPLLGTSDAANYWLDGDVAELIIFPRVLTTSERTAVQDYLNTRYGFGIDARTGTSSVTGAGSAPATGRKGATVAVPVSGAGSVTAIGVHGTTRTASLSGAGAATTSGTKHSSVTAPVAGGGTVSSAGIHGTTRSSSVTASATSTATGTKGAKATSAVTGAGVVTSSGSGSTAGSGTSTVTGTGVVAAIGRKGGAGT